MAQLISLITASKDAKSSRKGAETSASTQTSNDSFEPTHFDIGGQRLHTSKSSFLPKIWKSNRPPPRRKGARNATGAANGCQTEVKRSQSDGQFSIDILIKIPAVVFRSERIEHSTLEWLGRGREVNNGIVQDPASTKIIDASRSEWNERSRQLIALNKLTRMG